MSASSRPRRLGDVDPDSRWHAAPALSRGKTGDEMSAPASRVRAARGFLRSTNARRHLM
jgi:hypothetical protein